MYSRFEKVVGGDRERGRVLGKRLQDRIITEYENQIRFHKINADTGDFSGWTDQCAMYLPYIKSYAPRVLEELQGYAEGAEMPLSNVLALTTEYEYRFGSKTLSPSDKCTAFAAAKDATIDGIAFCGQTNDERFDEWPPELDVVIHHKDTSGMQSMIYTHPGVPAYMGMSSCGFAILWTYIDNGEISLGVPTNVIIRQVLFCNDFDEACEFIENVPHAVPNQFMLCSADGRIVSYECFPNKVYKKHGENILACANHITFAAEEDKGKSWSSKTRHIAMEEELNEVFGRIDLEKAKDILRSHRYFPASICSHPNGSRPVSKTLCAMVFDISNGIMHAAFGNPCEMPYHTFSFDKVK